MIILRIFEKIGVLYPINQALHDISEVYSEGFEFSDVNWKARSRFKLWTAGEWWYLWRWRGLYCELRHKFRMWQHKHNLLCRCVTYYQENGVHKENCPKHKKVS